MSQSNSNLGSKESSLFLCESSDFDQMPKKFSTPTLYKTVNALLNKLHQEIDSIVILEHIIHAYNKWMFDIIENILF